MRKVSVYLRGMLVGELEENSPDGFIFRYNDDYYHKNSKPDLSLTMTKKQKEYRSRHLFPVFYNLLTEGESRMAQAALLGIDPEDDFGLLMATAQYDVGGGITVKPIESEETGS